MRRGFPARLTPAIALAVLLAAPRNGRADLVYVLNSGDASVSLIDSATRQEIRRLPTLREPHHLSLTPDRRLLVVADSGGNELMFLDPDSAEVLRRERISNPYHLEYSPDGRFLVIASLRRDQVDIYDATRDAAAPRLLARLRLRDKPSHIAFSPDSRIAYVTLQGTHAVVAVSLETQQPLWQAEVGREPAGVVWHDIPGVGGRLLVGIMGSDHLAVLNPETRQVERTIFIGRGAHTVFRSPDGSTLWVTSRVDSRLTALDPATLTMRRVYDIPGGPDCIAFDPDGRLWMTLRWIGRVGVLDPETGQVETIRVGRSPHGIFVQPQRPGGAPPAPTAAAPPATAVRGLAATGGSPPLQPAWAPAGQRPPVVRP